LADENTRIFSQFLNNLNGLLLLQSGMGSLAAFENL